MVKVVVVVVQVVGDEVAATVHLLVHQHGLDAVVSEARLQVARVYLLLRFVDQAVHEVTVVVVHEAAVAAGLVVGVKLVPLVVEATAGVHEKIADSGRLSAADGVKRFLPTSLLALRQNKLECFSFYKKASCFE